jgi:MSHA biogenesis protein MshE
MPPAMLERVRRVIQRPSGMVLVTGPTGSGKTTTLYAALAELNTPERKIITVEDPVEYRLPGLNQVQVHEKIDLTFGRVLRTALRQDPDVILVGEMRDQGTVETGLRAALTGHLVLSTLHTNDAVSTPMRLLDMGAPRYMVAMSLQMVIAQRLLRIVCDKCGEWHEPDPHEREWLRLELGDRVDGFRYRRGRRLRPVQPHGLRRPDRRLRGARDDAPGRRGRQPASPQAFLTAARQQMGGETLAPECRRARRSGPHDGAEAMHVSNQFED